MTVVRWNPFRDLDAIQNVVDRMVYDTWRPFERAVTEAHNLPLDVYESNHGYLVVANIPGVHADQIEVRLENNVLTISAEIPENTIQAEGTRSLFRERPAGRFVRRLQLPQDVDFNAADATYEHGVLTLEIAKRPEAQPKLLTVRTGNGNGNPNSNS